MVSINDILSQVDWRGTPLSQSGQVNINANPWAVSNAPLAWANYAKWAAGPGGPLQAQTTGAFLSQMEGMNAAQRETATRGGFAAAQEGISPTQYQGMLSEQNRGFLSDAANARAASQAAYAGGVMSLGQETLNAVMASSEAERNRKFANYQFEQQMQAMHRGQNMSLIGSIISGAATVGAAMIPGIGPVAAGAMMASRGMGGGGSPGEAPMSYPAGGAAPVQFGNLPNSTESFGPMAPPSQYWGSFSPQSQPWLQGAPSTYGGFPPQYYGPQMPQWAQYYQPNTPAF